MRVLTPLPPPSSPQRWVGCLADAVKAHFAKSEGAAAAAAETRQRRWRVYLATDNDRVRESVGRALGEVGDVSFMESRTLHLGKIEQRVDRLNETSNLDRLGNMVDFAALSRARVIVSLRLASASQGGVRFVPIKSTYSLATSLLGNATMLLADIDSRKTMCGWKTATRS